jgi:hypothetical protein
MEKEIISLSLVLNNSEPKIKRTIEVYKDTYLVDLHEILQVVFMWNNTHAYNFEMGKNKLIDSKDEIKLNKADFKKKHNTQLPKLLAEGLKKISYFYDLGANWEVEIKFGKISNADDGLYPRITAGENASPPDDCGGIDGFYTLVNILANPTHIEHAEFKRRISNWAGLKGKIFDPSYVNFEKIHKPLEKLAVKLAPKAKKTNKVWMYMGK